MLVTVVKSTVVEKEGNKGPYKVAELVYKSDGKIKTTNVPSWEKAAFEVVSNVNSDDNLDISFEKNSKGYWQVKSVSQAGKDAVPTASKATSAPVKGNWETSEERAARQVYIVRQSSLSNAIEFLSVQPKTKFEVSDVVNVARQFEAYVFGNDAPVEVTGDVE